MLITNFTPRDNASHYSSQKDYIEWWYVDSIFNSGHQLAGSFAIWGNPRSQDCVTRSDFLLVAPDGSILDFSERVNPLDFEASINKCDVRLGRHFLRDRGGTYHLHLERIDGVILELSILPDCPGFGYQHFFDSSHNLHFSWVVPAARAAVNGFLQLGDESIALTGCGYHDHNWASVSLSRALKGWTWGRFFGEGSGMVYAVVEGTDSKLFGGLAYLDQENRRTDYRYLRFGFPPPEINLQIINSGWNLSISEPEIQVDMILEKISLVLQKERGSDYSRFLSRANIQIKMMGHEFKQTGFMIHEFKQLE